MTKNAWASVQDALLLSSVTLVAMLLALEYDLFNFAEQLSVPQRRIGDFPNRPFGALHLRLRCSALA
jgi:hypothetical protein